MIAAYLHHGVVGFVCGFTSQSRIFHSFGDVAFTVKGCKFLPIVGIHRH